MQIWKQFWHNWHLCKVNVRHQIKPLKFDQQRDRKWLWEKETTQKRNYNLYVWLASCCLQLLHWVVQIEAGERDGGFRLAQRDDFLLHEALSNIFFFYHFLLITTAEWEANKVRFSTVQWEAWTSPYRHIHSQLGGNPKGNKKTMGGLHVPPSLGLL